MSEQKGFFTSLEGIGGCGKSTIAKNLIEHLRSTGYQCVLTREPGGTPGAEEIRELILAGEGDRWSPETEILLFNAARRDHLERLIWPALDEGKIVITDRFVDSTRVYQGVARDDLRAHVDTLHKAAIDYEPDLVLIIDVTAEEGSRRIGIALRDEQDRFDEMGFQFQQDLRNGYLALARESNRYVVVDGHGSPEQVFQRVWEVFRSSLPEMAGA